MAVVRNWFQDQTSHDKQHRSELRWYDAAEAHHIIQDRTAQINAASAVRFVIDDTEAAWDPLEKRKFTAYHVRISIEGQAEFTIIKRYSFIYAIRESWQKHFLGKKLPELPPKKFMLVANIAANVVNERRTQLERFLNEVAVDPSLLQSEEMLAFLRTTIVLTEPPLGSDNRSPSPRPRPPSPRPRAPSPRSGSEAAQSPPQPARLLPGQPAPAAPAPAAKGPATAAPVAPAPVSPGPITPLMPTTSKKIAVDENMTYSRLLDEPSPASAYASFNVSAPVLNENASSYSYISEETRTLQAFSSYALYTEDVPLPAAQPYMILPARIAPYAVDANPPAPAGGAGNVRGEILELPTSTQAPIQAKLTAPYAALDANALAAGAAYAKPAAPYALFDTNAPVDAANAKPPAPYAVLDANTPAPGAAAKPPAPYAAFDASAPNVESPYASMPQPKSSHATFDAAAPGAATTPYATVQDDSASSYATFKPAPGAAASSYSSIAPGAPSAAAPAEPGAAALPPLPSAALQGAKAPTERPQLPSAALRPQRQLPLPKFRAWNEEFQRLLEEKDALASDNTEGLAEVAQKLQTLVQDFTAQAKAIANTILSEMFLPTEQRTIPPLDAGGIAGGVKFLVNDIFFKVASDEHGLYGSYQYAQKAALLEFSGLMSLLHVRIYSKIRGFHLPLMCILSSRGFTLTASSVLPLGKDTLIYGSADAAQTVHTDDPEVNELVKTVMTTLNVKGHYAGLQPTKVFIYGPVDVEVHRGYDGRVYIIDTARIFPAETPDRSRGGAVHLFRLLRPELVRSYEKPLNSDAFSRMATYDAKTHNDEVREATTHLLTKVMSQLGSRLWNKLGSQAARKFSNEAGVRMTMLFHQHGVNMRRIGTLYHTNPNAPTGSIPYHICLFLLHEAVARALKNLYFAAVRERKSADPEVIRQTTASFLNEYFFTDSAAKWIALHEALQRDFHWNPVDGSPEEVRRRVNPGALLDRWQGITGVKLVLPDDAHLDEFLSHGRLTPSNVKEIDVRVKFMYIFGMWQGQALANAAEKMEGDYAEQVQLKAAQQLRAALAVYPGEEEAYISYGKVLQALAKVATAKDDQDGVRRLLDTALDQFENAEFQAPKHPVPLRLTAVVHTDIGIFSAQQDLGGKEQRFKMAIESAGKAIELARKITPSTAEFYAALYTAGRAEANYADMLLETNRFAEAETEFSKALSLINNATDLQPTDCAKALIELAFVHGLRAKNPNLPMNAKPNAFAQTFAAFERAAQVARTAEDAANVQVFWGMFLTIQTDLVRQQPNVATALRQQAQAKFEEATRLRPAMWKAWWLWSQNLMRQAEFLGDVGMFQTGLRKIRNARQAFPSLAWGKQVEAELLYHLAMRTTDAKQRKTQLSECLALLGEVKSVKGQVRHEQMFAQLEARAQAELDRLNGIGLQPLSAAAPAPLPATQFSSHDPTIPAPEQQTALAQAFSANLTPQQNLAAMQQSQRHLNQQAVLLQALMQQMQMGNARGVDPQAMALAIQMQMQLQAQQGQAQGHIAAQLQAHTQMQAQMQAQQRQAQMQAAQMQAMQRQAAQMQAQGVRVGAAPQQLQRGNNLLEEPPVMQLAPSGPFTPELIAQLGSPDATTAFRAVQQLFGFAQYQPATHVPMLSAGLIEKILQLDLLNSQNPDTRLLVLTTIFCLTNSPTGSTLLMQKPILRPLLSSIRTLGPFLRYAVKDQSNVSFVVGLSLYGAAYRLCAADAAAAAGSISSIEWTPAGQATFINLIIRNGLALLGGPHERDLLVAELVLKFLLLLGSSGYAAAILDAPDHLELWIAHFVRNSGSATAFLCSEQVLRSPQLYTRVIHEVVSYLSMAGKPAHGFTAVYILLDPLLSPSASDACISAFLTQGGSAMLLKGGMNPQTAIVPHCLRLIAKLLSRATAAQALRQQGADLILYNLSIEAPTEQYTSQAASLLQQLLAATQDMPLSALNCVKAGRCTHTLTGGDKPLQQLLYVCKTCALPQGAAICAVCAKACHKDHQLGCAFGPEATGTCDCPDFLKARCKAK